jgi:hypothetical protein
MFSISRWMIAYGLLLIACDLLDWLAILPINSSGGLLISCWAGGAIMIAAGICAAQGRRSLRLTGTYIGLLLPLILAGIYAWRASVLWRFQLPNQPMLPALCISSLALLSLTFLMILVKLRPREGIASRGYAVSIPPPIKPNPVELTQNPRRSEVG